MTSKVDRALFDPHRPDRVEVFDLPNVAGGIEGSSQRGIVQRFSAGRAVLEDVHPMPKQGVTSTFKFGRSSGTTIGVLECLGLSISYVSPTRWKRRYRLDSGGENSRRRALDLFPDSAAFFARKKDHNRAEAALIARWGSFDENDIYFRDGFLLESNRRQTGGDRFQNPVESRDLTVVPSCVDGLPSR